MANTGYRLDIYRDVNVFSETYNTTKTERILDEIGCPPDLNPNSYVILTDDTRIDFELDNTPINNFRTSGNDTSSLTINGQDIVKNTIKEIYFGESYNGVNSIGNYFLYQCESLTSVNLSPLSNVTSIGDRFLGRCSGLTSVNLSPLSNVTSIGTYFLYQCESLTSVDLSPLSNVTSIGDRFLSRCSGLTSVDLSPLSNVTSIGTYFLQNCTGLSSVDLSPLSKVTSIGNSFLYQCTNLTSVDLSPFSNITSIGGYFLQSCSGLINIYGTTNFNNNLNLKESKLLTHESLLNVLNSLADLTSTDAKVLTLYTDSYNLLTEDDILTITNKNWTIAL